MMQDHVGVLVAAAAGAFFLLPTLKRQIWLGGLVST